MRTRLFPILIMLSSLLTACGGFAFAQDATPSGLERETPRTLTVSGSGKAYLVPDIAYVNIGVHTEGKYAIEAVSTNNSQAQKVIDALKSQGIDEKDIQTTNFSINPQQQYDSQGKPTGEIIYQVDNSVVVTVRNIDKVGQVLDAAVKAGANSINSIEFDVAEKSQALSESRKAAVEDAKTKAKELAEAAGIILGEVQTISEYTARSPSPAYRSAAPAYLAEEAMSVPIQSGQMMITVEVSIVYLIQ